MGAPIPLYEPLESGRNDNIFISKSYDATSHFETTTGMLLLSNLSANIADGVRQTMSEISTGEQSRRSLWLRDCVRATILWARSRENLMSASESPAKHLTWVNSVRSLCMRIDLKSAQSRRHVFGNPYYSSIATSLTPSSLYCMWAPSLLLFLHPAFAFNLNPRLFSFELPLSSLLTFYQVVYDICLCRANFHLSLGHDCNHHRHLTSLVGQPCIYFLWDADTLLFMLLLFYY